MATVTAAMVSLAAALNVDATLDAGGSGDGGGGVDFNNDCSSATPAFCASLQRLSCSNYTRIDTCGDCVGGDLTAVMIDSSQHSPCVSLYASDPTLAPTAVPTPMPSVFGASNTPSTVPSVAGAPTVAPTAAPSVPGDTHEPSPAPFSIPTMDPSTAPTPLPSGVGETLAPSLLPTFHPSPVPSVLPTAAPSETGSPTGVTVAKRISLLSKSCSGGRASFGAECSGHGTCSFFYALSLAPLADGQNCVNSDSSCVALCVCDAGYA
jgi:hypothetical protein